MARIAEILPAGMRLTDHISLDVLTAQFPRAIVERVLADTARQSVRERALPGLLRDRPRPLRRSLDAGSVALRGRRRALARRSDHHRSPEQVGDLAGADPPR